MLRAAGATAALALLAVGGVAGANAWVARTTSGRIYNSVDSVPARSVAIVPGARVYKGKPYGHLLSRLQTALMLYQGGRVKKILVSGNDTTEAPEATVMSAWLREHGVDDADILVDASGSRTRATMDRAADIYDIRDAVICTQDANTSRSLFLAKAAGIDAIAFTIPSALVTSPRYMRVEALKTAMAFVESYLWAGLRAFASARARTTVAAR